MIEPEVVELNEEIVKFTCKKPLQKKRLTIRKQNNSAAMGIFSNSIQSRLIEVVPKSPAKLDSSKSGTVSTSSIYVESDYEAELFQEPTDMEMASFYHNQQQNSQWFQEHSFTPHPEDDSNWLYGSLEFTSRPKTNLKIHSQPF
jgi:hypothetical protein